MNPFEQPSSEQAPNTQEKVVVAGEVDFEQLDPKDQEQLNAQLHVTDDSDEGFESLADVLKKLS